MTSVGGREMEETEPGVDDDGDDEDGIEGEDEARALSKGLELAEAGVEGWEDAPEGRSRECREAYK